MNILITGASSGIGKRLAIDYLKAGHVVYCCGRDLPALNQIKERFPNLAIILNFDVCSLEACAESFSSLKPLDLVILNAGTCEYIDARSFDGGGSPVLWGWKWHCCVMFLSQRWLGVWVRRCF